MLLTGIILRSACISIASVTQAPLGRERASGEPRCSGLEPV